MMETDSEKSELLSSWKEISAYLKCDQRTCFRWEKKLGLPIHRIEGTQKSRVYAYKSELDEWLKAKLNNGKSKAQTNRESTLESKSRASIVLFIVFCLSLAFIVYYFFLNPRTETPVSKPGIPQSTGPLTLKNSDIITAEFPLSRSLRVWRKDKSNEYKEIWKIQPVRHASFAIGNLDDHKDFEVVAPGVCRVPLKTGDRESSRQKFFLNVYKQGEKDWWKTTFYSDENCVFEPKNFMNAEIAIGDVDDDNQNEIVLVTMNMLALFRYNQEKEEFELLRSRSSFLDDTSLFIKSVVVINIDKDPAEEIIISADERIGQNSITNKGYIFILKTEDGWPRIINTIQVDANLAYQSLRVGDVTKGGFPEIVSPGYRQHNDIHNTYILVWNTQGEKIFDHPVYDNDYLEPRYVHLDVGDLNSCPGDEIVLGNQSYDYVSYYTHNGDQLVESSRFPLENRVTITNIFVSDPDKGKDILSDIIVCGHAQSENGSGQFYLEILGYENGFFSKWKRIGGNAEEGIVAYAAIGNRK